MLRGKTNICILASSIKHVGVIVANSENGRYITRSRRIRVAGAASSVALLLIALLAAFPVSYQDKNAEATAVPATTTLTMTSSSDIASVDITPNSGDGTFVASTSDIAFSVTTDNLTGYSLSISGSDNDGELANVTTGDVLGPLSSAASTSDFTSGAAATYSNKWGYKPSKYNSTSNSSYLPAPTTSQSVLDTTSSPNPTANNYTIGIAARVDFSKPVGTYTNTYTVTAISNPVLYEIRYIEDTGDTSIANWPANESNTTEGITDLILSNQVPTRDNHTFLGWCDGTVTHVAGGDSTCSGTTYNAGDGYTLLNPSSSTYATINMYAMWRSNLHNLTINFASLSQTRSRAVPDPGVESVQVRTEAGTGGTLIGTVTTSGDVVSGLINDETYYLYPTFTSEHTLSKWEKNSGKGYFSDYYEDNPSYTIGAGDAEITIIGKDSKHYIQDVTIDECTTLGTDASYTVRDKRDNNDYTVRLINGNCWMTSNLRFTGTQLSPETSNVMSDITITKDNGTEGYGSLSADGNSYTEARYVTGTDGNGDPTVWYNYAAATAKTISGSSTQVEAAQSICPKGWRLPTNDEHKGITSYALQYNTVGGGYYYNKAKSSPANGYWWSTTANDATDRYDLYYNGSTLAATSDYTRYGGFYVRCVLDKTMQSVDDAYAGGMAHGTTAVLSDARDNNTYKVTKINNTLWMTQNLRLNPGTATIDSINSNVGEDYVHNPSTWGSTLNAGTSDDPKYQDSNTVTKGFWYNYPAATAKSVASSTTTNPTQDLCPKGWRLPTQWEANEAASYSSLFSPVTGGEYTSQSGWGLKNTSYGFWWTSINAHTETYYFNSTSTTVSKPVTNTRYDGRYVRCVFDSHNEDIIAMQDVTPSMEQAMADGDSTKLVDIRDNNYYNVTKINGHLWMTQNLRLGGTGGNALDSTTSNVAPEYTPENPLVLTWGWTKKDTLAKSPHRGGSDNLDQGFWYDYAGATAGTVTKMANVGSSQYDICPKGWRLPTKAEAQSVVSYKTQFNPTTGGAWWTAGGTWKNQSTGSAWWYTSEKGNGNYIDMIKYNGSTLAEATTDNNAIGDAYFVRCIYGDHTEPTYMQDVTTEMVDAMSDGDTDNLPDKRDYTRYDVTKINGNLWMTQNLKFDGTTLDSTTSNVAPEYTPSNPLTITWGNAKSRYATGPTKAYTDNFKRGNWYGYTGATAGTFTSWNDADPIYSICPAGWRLPTKAELQSLKGYEAQFKATTGGGWWQNSHENGWYNYQTGYGWYFSSTVMRDDKLIYMLKNNGSSLVDSDSNAIHDAYFVRCIFNKV